jgi:hypothetical protein
VLSSSGPIFFGVFSFKLKTTLSRRQAVFFTFGLSFSDKVLVLNQRKTKTSGKVLQRKD